MKKILSKVHIFQIKSQRKLLFGFIPLYYFFSKLNDNNIQVALILTKRKKGRK